VEQPTEEAGGPVTAIRGHAISFRADPFREDDALIDVADALIIMRDGRITHFGAYSQLRDLLPGEVTPVTYPGALISAGFIDGHVHYAQTRIIGAYGEQLADWLATYAFAEEERFADPDYAALAARVFFDQILASGTTTALTFCATYPASVDAFFAETERRGMRMIGGKVLMDRNAPDSLLDTARSGYEDSRTLIDRWHGQGRGLYAITPRFAPTSTPEQLELAGSLLAESPGTLLHTHVSENRSEVDRVRALFPERAGYLDVYDHYGLLGPRSVLAHGVHLTARERRRVHESGAAITHCPTSNLFLGSGLFRVQEAKESRQPVRLALGTDIGAGTSFSLLATMNEAHKVAKLAGYPMSAVKSFYLATRGGAEALGLDGRIGSLEPGHEADLVVLDPAATPLLAYRSSRAESTQELMFILSVLGDDRAVAATYVAGRPAYVRT
jgi:guanine deaminase